MKRKFLFAALISIFAVGLTAPLATFADDHSKAGIERVEAAVKDLKEAITHFEASKTATNSPHDDAAVEHAKMAIEHAETAIEHAKQVP